MQDKMCRYSWRAGCLVLAFLASACIGRKAEIPEQKQEIPPRQDGPVQPVTPKKDDNTFELKEASAVIAISEADIKRAAPKENIKIADLQYKVTYQDVVIGPEPLTFKNGKAVVTLTSLPAEQVGDLKFEILLQDKPKLAAVVADVSLPAEKVSPVKVDLEPVTDAGGTSGGTTGGTSGGTTGGTSGGTTGGTSGGTTGGTSGGTTGGTSGGTTGGTSGGTTPSAWDGKSDQGSSKWKIVPLN